MESLRWTLGQNVSEKDLGTTFMACLRAKDNRLECPSNIEDVSLNAAWNFCDYYFDALNHGSREFGGISTGEARLKIEKIIAVLEREEEINDEQVLSFYYRPERWRFGKAFPWASRRKGG